MAPLIPDDVPRHFAQGTTLRYTRSLPEFAPSEGWSYTIYFNGLTQKASQAGATFDPATFLVEMDAAATALLPPGPYRYAERLVNPGTAFVLTSVVSDGQGNAVYSFSSYKNIAPYPGMPVTVAGFTNSGNNLSAVISAFTGGPEGGTFTVANAGAVNETHAATAQGAAEVYDITGDELVVNVEPSAKDSPAGAFQTFEEKQLAAIEAVIAARNSGTAPSADIQHYEVAGRAVTKMSLTELLRLRGMYRAVVWRQQHPGKLGRPFKVHFTPGQEGTEIPPTWVDVTGADFVGRS